MTVEAMKEILISQEVKNVYGVMKAYSTKVGDGPYPTEQINDIGEIFTGYNVSS